MSPGKIGPATRMSTWAIAAAFAFVGSLLSGTAFAQATNQKHGTMTKILIEFEHVTVTATIDDSAAARDFLALLPLALTLEDYHNTEKISDLPGPLSTEGAPQGIDPQVGDITYYAPWGNLAIFYRDFGYARGLVHLGRIDSGIEVFQQKGPHQVTIKRAD